MGQRASRIGITRARVSPNMPTMKYMKESMWKEYLNKFNQLETKWKREIHLC